MAKPRHGAAAAASGSALRPYTYTFCLERLENGPCKVLEPGYGRMAKRKAEHDAEGAPAAKARRPNGYWRPFNTWWRVYQEDHGQRPSVKDMTDWHTANAKAAWGSADVPPLTDMLKTAKGLRPLQLVRKYFCEYRRKKREAKVVGESPLKGVSAGPVSKPSCAAKPCGGRIGSSSSEDEGPGSDAESDMTDIEDAVLAQLVQDVEEATGGQQQPQQPGFPSHLVSGATAARQAYNVACAAAIMAAATAAAAAAHAMHAPTAGFESQAGTSGGAQESDQEALCYTPQPDVEAFGASLAHQGSWLQSVQEAAATTALDPAGLGFTQPPAAHTGGSHAPSPAGAAISPPMPSAICTMPSAPACEGAAAPHLPRHQLGGRFDSTAGSASLPSYGSVPPPPLPPHVTRHVHLQPPHGPAVSELPGGGSRSHSLPCSALPPAAGPQRFTAPSGSLNGDLAVAAPPVDSWHYYHVQQQHAHQHHALAPPPQPPHGSAAAPAPYRCGPSGYPAHPVYPHGYPHGYSGYGGYTGYGGYGYPPGPAASHEQAGHSLTSFHDDVDLDAVLEAEMGDHYQQVQQQQQATRPSEGGKTDAFADLWVRWEEDTGADAAPAVCKDATASGPGMQPRTRVPVHVFHE
eukprot:XP_001692881.1 predicted protein [Chlamydomonas reinhardtii]